MPDIFTKPTELTKPLTLPPSQGHVLSSFCVAPKNIFFQNQEANEQTILLLRAHGITNIGWIITSILFSLLPVFLIPILPYLESTFALVLQDFLIPIMAIYYMGIVIYIFINAIKWFYNIFLVTTKKVVDIDFNNVMYQDIAISKLQEIEEVHYTQNGFFASLFNYGDIEVQTEANKANFEASKVPNPSYAASLMASYIEREKND